MAVCLDENSGFSFENSLRNSYLATKGYNVPKQRKTGTTLVGALYKDGVVIGADSRATCGDLVSSKFCMKVHYLTPNMSACGAGTAADLEQTCKMMSSQLELHRLNTGRTVPGITACRLIKQMLFRYQGYISCWLLVCGVDDNGPFLYSLSAHGSSSKVPYDTNGSGSMAAMAILESRWKPNMELEDCKKLVADSVTAGGMNDLASGNSVSLAVITKDKVLEMQAPYKIIETKGEREGVYEYKRGSTAVLSTRVVPLKIENIMVKTTDDSSMDTS